MASLMNVQICTLRKWESGISIISRKNYETFKSLLDKKNKTENFLSNDNYLSFLNNNPQKLMKNYIEIENITIEDFAKRMDRHPTSIRNMINFKTTITRKQYSKFEELLKKQKLGIISSNSYINFIKTKQSVYIYKILKDNNLTKTELSKNLKISRSTVERWMKNETIISKKSYYKLLNFVTEYNKKNFTM